MKVRVLLSTCGNYYNIQEKKLFGWKNVHSVSSKNYNENMKDNVDEAIEYANRLLNNAPVFIGKN